MKPLQKKRTQLVDWHMTFVSCTNLRNITVSWLHTDPMFSLATNNSVVFYVRCFILCFLWITSFLSWKQKHWMGEWKCTYRSKSLVTGLPFMQLYFLNLQAKKFSMQSCLTQITSNLGHPVTLTSYLLPLFAQPPKMNNAITLEVLFRVCFRSPANCANASQTGCRRPINIVVHTRSFI